MHAIIIRGPLKSLLFLPDHDSWDETLEAHNCDSIRSFLAKFSIDIALLDGTFWSGGELKGEICAFPHPTVEKSLHRLGETRPMIQRFSSFISTIQIHFTIRIRTNRTNSKTQAGQSGMRHNNSRFNFC